MGVGEGKDEEGKGNLIKGRTRKQRKGASDNAQSRVKGNGC